VAEGAWGHILQVRHLHSASIKLLRTATLLRSGPTRPRRLSSYHSTGMGGLSDGREGHQKPPPGAQVPGVERGALPRGDYAFRRSQLALCIGERSRAAELSLRWSS
jgi:hypothetical protein